MCKRYIDTNSISKLKNLSNSSRYRILLLTSAPILITLLILIFITLYWAFSYTWKNTLHDVSTRLKIAQNSFIFIQNNQGASLSSISQSYDFQKLLNNNTKEEEINKSLYNLKQKYKFDYIKFRYLSDVNEKDSITHNSGFEIVSPEKLNSIDSKLALKAKIRLYQSDFFESKALVLRAVTAVYNQKINIIGYIEGGIVINNSVNLVDNLRNLIYPPTNISQSAIGTVTIFMNDIRISTNVPKSMKTRIKDNSRAIGTKVSKEVADTVLRQGKEWIGMATVIGNRYITAYQPIKDSNNNVIGILYTGYSLWSFFKDYIISISTLLLTAIILLAVSIFFVIRESFSLFAPLEKIGHVVLKIRNGEHARIGELGLHREHELSLLSNQFDQMLDDLDARKNEISSLVSVLEIKVEERTEKLKVKTKQLEHHINLLNQTKNKLVAQEKFAALGVLTAGIAHEINNPVAVILGNTELIKRTVSQKNIDIDSEISIIFEQIDRIKSIIYSLLQYSKSSSNPNCKPSIQNINPIILESITLINTGSNKKNITFKSELNATERVLIDKNQLLQVLINLELNAIDAIGNIGEITISTSNSFDKNNVINGILINVIDKGCGIENSHINKIFDPFFTTKKDGTGLGLAVSNSLINQMGGEINVSINEDKETVFSIYLPIPSIYA